jgi:cysteine desulfurase / selenocysteine lyase
MKEEKQADNKELDIEGIRKDFPILNTKMNGKDLIYLDSAATSQKPIAVLEAMDNYYKTYNANVHRGVYKIAEKATEGYIDSKNKIARFINANSMEEIIYGRNATEAINLVAYSWGDANIKKGDHILLSEMEHHSNMVPWMMLAKRKGAVVDYITLDKSNSRLDAPNLDKMLEKQPKIVAITHASNVLGTINDVKGITRKAHEKGAVVLIDAAQSTPHMKVDVKDINSDFFVFSAHKMLGPTGIGALHSKEELLNSMEPVFGGGDMIKSVSYDSYSWNDLPWKFEAGTPNIAGGIGFGAAIDYLESIGMEKIRNHEKELTKYALEKLNEIKGVTTYGLGKDDIAERGGVISFDIKGVHPHDVAQIFDSEGIAIRAGHHCAMPLVTQKIGLPAVSRMSFYFYNKKSEIDATVNAIEKVKRIFKVG